MPDVFTKAKRSEVMARIRGRGNKDTELAFLRLLRAEKIAGWRRHFELPLAGASLGSIGAAIRRRPKVRPDFVFPALRLAVFVDGCFWHSCPTHASAPKGNEVFWQIKLANNRARDRYVTDALRRRGWAVMRIWEHDLRRKDRVVARLRRNLGRREEIHGARV